ncbi:hypothetical protein A0U40_09690 [[Bacillus] sp. KCTC 13219]|nr:hypothetical protein A0U40_09690 [[Bacillus] sp. KCTC 13219]
MKKLLNIENEIRKEKACCMDLVEAIKLHIKFDQHDLVQKRINDLQKSTQRVEQLEIKRKVERKNELSKTIEQLRKEGKIVQIGARTAKKGVAK